MGLAERFRGKLEQQDIFSTPDTASNSTVIPIKKVNCSDLYKKFEDLETDTISKIRQTPYWHDYPLKKQENMIGKYFDSKIKSKYSDINYTSNEKIGFIKNIINLANNR